MLICIHCGNRGFLPTNATSSNISNRIVNGVTAKPATALNHRLRVGVVPLVQAKLLSRPVVIVLVSCVLFLFVLLMVGSDTLADLAVDLTPHSKDQEYGRQSSEYKEALNSSLPSSTQISQEVEEIGKRLVSAIQGGTPFQYTFHVIPSDGINAFALPGGDIFILTGLIRQAGTKDQVAAVLAHEIQHVEKRHGIRKYYRSLGRVGMFSLVFGIFGDNTAMPITQLSILRYSRSLETDADLQGLKLLHAAGIPREAMVEMLSGLDEQSRGVSVWLSDHPDSKRRALAVANAPLN